MESDGNAALRRYHQGEISEREYLALRRRALERHLEQRVPETTSPFWGMSETTYCAVMNLSVYLNVVFPLLGLVTALILWLRARRHSDLADRHGRNILNWQMACLLYLLLLGFVLLLVCQLPSIAMVCVGAGLLLMGAILIYPIIGCVAACQGNLWRFPGALQGFV